MPEFEEQAQRLADRLRALPESRLARPTGGAGTVADQAHALGQVLADLAADLEGRERRDVPRLHDLASGDQVALLAHDLRKAVASPRAGAAQVAKARAVASAAVRALGDQV